MFLLPLWKGLHRGVDPSLGASTAHVPGLHLHPMTQRCKYDFALDQRTIWLWKSLRSSPASTDSALQIRLRLRPKDHMILRQSPRFHLHPMIQRCKYFSLRQKDHMIIKQITGSSPASNDSTLPVRVRLKPQDHMIVKKNPGFHLRPMIQRCNYDFALDQWTIWF